MIWSVATCILADLGACCSSSCRACAVLDGGYWARALGRVSLRPTSSATCWPAWAKLVPCKHAHYEGTPPCAPGLRAPAHVCHPCMQQMHHVVCDATPWLRGERCQGPDSLPWHFFILYTFFVLLRWQPFAESSTCPPSTLRACASPLFQESVRACIQPRGHRCGRRPQPEPGQLPENGGRWCRLGGKPEVHRGGADGRHVHVRVWGRCTRQCAQE